jgi:transcriptional regulator with XRE-family HTH domain
MHVGARVRTRRRFLGLTQQALAESLGLTFQQVQKYERGANRISASKLYEIGCALKVPAHYFFEGLADTGSEGDDIARETEVSIREFLMTPEGQELAQLYPSIGSPRLRRQVLELVRAIAGDDPDGS